MSEENQDKQIEETSEQKKPKDKKKFLRLPKAIINFDDKDLVILVIGGIAIASLWKLQNPMQILPSIVSGLFALAVGKNFRG